MNDLVERLAHDSLVQWTARQLVEAAWLEFYVFVLVFVRVSGLMIIGPLFGQALVPAQVRFLLIFSVALLVTPILGLQQRQAAVGWDQNRDGRISVEEVPGHLTEEFESMLASRGRLANGTISPAEFSVALRQPASVLELMQVIVLELLLGFALGLGVFTLLSGLQLAAQLIDQQAGVALGEVFNPALDVETSHNGQILYMLGIVVLLSAPPLGLHLQMMSALLETFRIFPVGMAVVGEPTIEVLSGLVHQSLVLAVQVAAPMLATMSLVSLALGFLGHSVPQVNVLMIGFSVRTIISILILALTLSGVSDALIERIPQAIAAVQGSFSASL